MWTDGAPNFLIGLREGLEAGLVVSIVLATVARGGRGSGRVQVWAGLAFAAALSLGFGAVLTFAAADLSTKAQEALGGTLSLVAVGFVTWMVFWMRRSARTLSADLRSRTETALEVGGRLLFGIAFFAVAREGLETALFLWSTTRTAGESTGPLVGAVAGLAVAALLCWALYRRALKINLSKFFAWTGGGLIVIAAGVAAYGVRELQGAGILGGADEIAFDVSGRVDPSAWYSRLVEGAFNLTAQMTVAQIVAYVLYLVPVLTVFIVMTARSQAPAPAAVGAAPSGTSASGPLATTGSRRPSWLILGVAGAVFAALTMGLIVVVGPKDASDAAGITVTDESCAPGWTAPQAGQRTFEIRNLSAQQVEIYLMDADRTHANGEIEGLAPGTTRPLTVSLGPGSYVWRCVSATADETFSESRQVTGDSTVAATPSYVPVTIDELNAATRNYRDLITPALNTLATNTDALLTSVEETGASDASKRLWLTAHLDYVDLGAAYGTFGELDAKINGRPNDLPGGVNDPTFTGFLRLERELWDETTLADIVATTSQLDANVHDLVATFPQLPTDPRDLPLRAHEILEDGIQFELTGDTDHGSHTNLATLRTQVDATRVVLGTLAPLLTSRNPELLAQLNRDLDRLATDLDQFVDADGHWTALGSLTSAQRRLVNGEVSQMAEDLALVPTILELPLSAN